MAKAKYNTELIVSNLSKKFGSAYDYSNVEYNGDKPISITCIKHNLEIKNHYYNLIKKSHLCNKCKIEENHKAKLITKLREKFGDKYDYSNIEYINNQTNVTLICPVHGEITMRPADVNKYNGCYECIKLENTIKEKNKWIAKSKNKWGDLFNYDNVVYNGSQTEIELYCKTHGQFKTTPESHINSKSGGCKYCRYLYTSESNSLGYEEIISRANKIHDNRYTYIDNSARILDSTLEIICPIHGKFYQTVDNHLCGSGCPKCYKKTQSEIFNFIKTFSDTEILYDNRRIIKPFELDLYFPEYNYAIEYNGLMDHSIGYDSYSRFNNVNRFNEIKYKHRIKTDKCLEQGIGLFHIFESEWKDENKKDIIKSMIKLKLHCVNDRIHARKCTIKIIHHNVAKDFLNSNHLMGYKHSNIHIGLIYNNTVVSIMSFNKHDKYDYELTRFSTIKNTVIPGGASKLFKYFKMKYNPTSIVSYVNRRFGTGGVYANIGFNKIESNNEPFALFFKPNTLKLYTQTMFRKFMIKKYYEENKYDITKYDDSKSWIQNMLDNNYRVIFDSGNYTYVWEI